MYFHFVLHQKFTAYWTFLLTLCTSFCYSQDFIYKKYDVQNGLPNPTIHALFQDRDGFLWIGTESGLCRYDGSHFKNFTVNDGLPANEVLGVFQDSRGRIWLSFYKATIAYIYNGKIYNQENDSLLKKVQLKDRIVGIAENSQGDIIICVTTYFNLIRKNNTVDYYFPGRLGVIGAVHAYSDGPAFIIANSQEIYRFENDKVQFIRPLVYGPQLAQAGLLLNRNYFTHLYTDSIHLRDTIIRHGIQPKNIIKYSPVSDSMLSINTPEGAFLFTLNDYKLIKILPGIKVSNVFMDREKNIWIGTLGMGLYKMSSRAIVNKKIGENQDDISYVTKTQGKIVVGNNYSNVFEYEKNKFTMTYQRPEAVYSQTKVIYYDEPVKDEFIIGHSNFIVALRGGKISLRHFPRLKHVAPFDKDRLLLSMGYCLATVRKDDLYSWDTVWKQQSISALRTGDSILMGKLSALLVFKIENGGFVLKDSLLPGKNIIAINKSNDGLIWVCTAEHGLYCFQNGKQVRHFTESLGLPSNNVRTVFLEDNNAWFGTDKGLVKIIHKNGGFHLQKYSTADGLASNIINAIYVDSNTIYLGTPQGLCYFDERNIETNSFCNLVLTRVSIGDSTVDFGEKYRIRDGERLTVEFSGISLRSEQEMSFRYKINGIDENWRSSASNVLEFATLPFGAYSLQIVAINKFGRESKPLSINLEVMRPFHKTIWFWLLMILVPVLLIIFLVSRRIISRRKKQLQKLEQEMRITKLEQMALRAQMNPHFIFNCISAIQQLVIEKDTGNASRFIDSFAGLVRQTLDNAPEVFISLGEEIKFLNNYFELERIRLEDRFSYQIKTGGLTNKEQIRVPNMVIQPFVENAIKHGIRYKKNGKGYVEVNFEQQENLLRCTITDNGVGREKAMQMRKESGIHHASKGMSITMRRIESLNAVTNQKIYIGIEDLKDAQQLACGTRVKIDFYNINDNNDKDDHN